MSLLLTSDESPFVFGAYAAYVEETQPRFEVPEVEAPSVDEREVVPPEVSSNAR